MTANSDPLFLKGACAKHRAPESFQAISKVREPLGTSVRSRL
jgi:hypothetical protein